MEEEYIIHADSKNRNTKLFPKGNEYILNLNKTVSGVVRIDLISARVPNSMYNLSSNTANLVTTFTTNPFSLHPGFYSASTLENELNRRLLPSDECVYYSQHEGKFYYLSNDPDATLITYSSELAKMLGIDANKTYTVSPLDVSINSFYYAIESERVVDFSLNEYIFLDIEEFRGPHFCDADGEAENMFAVIPMDVYSGQVKTFKETSDYVISRKISHGMMTLSRLTVRWLDKDLKPLNFQGFENNGFVLRVYTERVTGPPPKIVDEVPLPPQPQPQPQKKKKSSTVFGKWAVYLGIASILLFWYVSKKFM